MNANKLFAEKIYDQYNDANYNTLNTPFDYIIFIDYYSKQYF